MSRFILTAQVRMRAPNASELNSIAAQIKSGLNGINVPININIPAAQQRILSNINTQLKTVQATAIQTSDSFENLGRSLSQNIRKYGSFTVATGAFIRLGIAIRQSIGEAIDFETEIRKIAQGQEKTIESYSGLRKEIDHLSTSLGVSSLDLAKSARTLAQAGYSATQVTEALEALAKAQLAPSFGSMNDNVEASIAIMKQFGIETSQLKSIIGSINKVSADFAVEAEDIDAAVRLAGASFAAASPQFQAGEESLRQFMALFTSVRQTTRGSAESIATGIRTIVTRLQRNSTVDLLKSMGIELRDADGQFIGAYESIRKISSALDGIPTTDSRFTNIAELLGGYRNIDKTIPLLQQFTVAQQAYNSALAGTGSLDKGIGLAQETLAQKFKLVGEEFNSLIRKFTENTGFRVMIDLALQLASAMIKVVAAVEPLLPLIAGIGLFKVGTAIPRIAKGFASDYKSVVGRKAEGGPILHFNKGGIVPGVGNSDSVPAMLTPGERVLNKADTRRYANAGEVKNKPTTFKEYMATQSSYNLPGGFYSKLDEKDSPELTATKIKIDAYLSSRKDDSAKKRFSNVVAGYSNFDAGIFNKAQVIARTKGTTTSKELDAIKRNEAIKKDSTYIARIPANTVGGLFAVNEGGGSNSTIIINRPPVRLAGKKGSQKQDPFSLNYENAFYRKGADGKKEIASSVVIPTKLFHADKAAENFQEVGNEIYAEAITKMVPLLSAGLRTPIKGKNVLGSTNKLRKDIIEQVQINDVLGKIFEGALSSIIGSARGGQNDNFDFINLGNNASIKTLFAPNESGPLPRFLDAKWGSTVGAISSLGRKTVNEFGQHGHSDLHDNVTPKDLLDIDDINVNTKQLKNKSYRYAGISKKKLANGGLVSGVGNIKDYISSFNKKASGISLANAKFLGVSRPGYSGEYNPKNKGITVKENQTDKELAQTLRHELAHHLDYNYDLNKTDFPKVVARKYRNADLAKRYFSKFKPDEGIGDYLSNPTESIAQSLDSYTDEDIIGFFSNKGGPTDKGLRRSLRNKIAGYTKGKKRPARFANGGIVPGVGNSDSVPMNLPNGAYVIRKKAVATIGASNLSKYADGGVANSLVMPGEYVFSPSAAKRIGKSTLGRLNHADKYALGGSVGGLNRFADGSEKFKVEGFNPITGETKIDIIIAKTAAHARAALDALGATLYQSVSKAGWVDQLENAINKVMGEVGFSKADKARTSSVTKDPTAESAAKAAVKRNPGAVYDSVERNKKLEAAGVLSPGQIQANKLYEKELNHAIRKDAFESTQKAKGSGVLTPSAAKAQLKMQRQGLRDDINAGVAGEQGEAGYKDFVRKNLANKDATKRTVYTDKQLEDSIIKDSGSTVRTTQIQVEAQKEELQRRRGIKTDVGTSPASSSSSGGESPGDSNNQKSSGADILFKAGQAAFAINMVGELGKSIGILGEHAQNSIGQFSGLIASFGVVAGSVQELKKILPSKVANALEGLEGKLVDKFKNLSKGQMATRIGLVIAGVVASAAGENIKQTGKLFGSGGVGGLEGIRTQQGGFNKNLDTATTGGAVSDAGKGLAIGGAVAGLPGAVVGAIGGALYGKINAASEAQKIIEDRQQKDTDKSLSKVSSGKYNRQDLGNIASSLRITENIRGKTKERGLNRTELEGVNFNSDTVTNLYKNASSLDQLKEVKSNTGIRKAAVTSGVSEGKQDLLAKEAELRLRNADSIEKATLALDKIAPSISAFNAKLSAMTDKLDVFDSYSDADKQKVNAIKGGAGGAIDLSKFGDLAKRGIDTPEISKLLATSNKPFLASKAKAEIDSSKAAKEVMANYAQNPEKGGIQVENLAQQLEKKLLAGGTDVKTAAEEKHKFTNFVGSKLNDGETSLTKTNQNLAEIGEAFANEQKKSLEAILKYNAAVNSTSETLIGFQNEIHGIKLEQFAKIAEIDTQYQGTTSKINELRDNPVNQVGIASSIFGKQLSSINSYGSLGLRGESPTSTVQELSSRKNQAEAGLATLTAKSGSGAGLDAFDAAASQAFNLQLKTATSGLELFAKGSEKYAQALEGKAMELKQRRDAASGTAVDYLTSDASGRRDIAKNTRFAAKFLTGGTTSKDFSGNKAGLDLARKLGGEQAYNDKLKQNPLLANIMKPSEEENKVHGQMAELAKASAQASVSLIQQTQTLGALGEAAGRAALRLDSILNMPDINIAQNQNGPNQNQQVVTHQLTAGGTIQINVTGDNRQFNKEQIEDIMKQGINHWWSQQQGQSNKVSMGVEHFERGK